jgi:hypothetical protein
MTTVTITAAMPLPEQLRLLDEGRKTGATIIFIGDWCFPETLMHYADTHGDPGYQDRYTAQAYDDAYASQMDRFTVHMEH